MKYLKLILACLVAVLCATTTTRAQDETVNGNLTVNGAIWQYSSWGFKIGHLTNVPDQWGLLTCFWDDGGSNGGVTFDSHKYDTTWRWDSIDYETGAGRWQMLLSGGNELQLFPYAPPTNYTGGFNDSPQIKLTPNRDYPQIYLGGMMMQYHEPGNGGGNVRFNTRSYVTEWVWGSDSYSGSMTLKQMELNYSNQLILYDREEEANNHASVIISPRSFWGIETPYIEVDGKRVVLESQTRPVRFDSVVRVAPQGDLSMGEFVTEPQ